MSMERKRKVQPRFFAWLLAAAALATFGPAAAQSKPDFEPAPALAAAELAPAALLKGPLHAVAEPVTVEGYFGRFVIESKYGRFSVLGVNMLAERVNELRAIEALLQVQRSAAFQDALRSSATAPMKFVASAADEPAKSVETAGQGPGSVLGRVGFGAKSGAEAAGGAASDHKSAPAASASPNATAVESEPPARPGDPFGYQKARREWARQLDIDPYTTNPVLRRLLDNTAAASLAGNFTASTALGAAAAPLNVAARLDATVRDAVWNQAAFDVARQNEDKLLALGVGERAVRDLQRNRWFTPTLQTALVGALAELGRIEGVESVIVAASRVKDETRARFLVDSVRMLARHHEKSTQVTKLRMSHLVPIAVEGDGTLVAAAAVDYVFWDKNTAEFAKRRDFTGKRRVLLVAGPASAMATQEFAKAGLTLRTGMRPG
jgi:hypothetical protein